MAHNSLEQHPAGNGTVQQAGGHEPVRYNPDAPSEEWGWHGSWRVFAPRGSRIILWAGVAIVALSAFTTEHVSHVEDYWVGGIALFGAVWLVSREVSGRRMRRRRHRQQPE